MVAVLTPMAAWLSASSNNKSATLGILAFETAKIMSRLISLYNSLTDDEMDRLRTETIPARGVAYLNGKDEGFLLNLAFNERLEDLNQAAIAVSGISRKCSVFGLNRFDIVHDDVKLGVINSKKLEFGSKYVQKMIEKTKKFISVTAQLHTALQSLSQLEQSEKKVQRWKKNVNGDPKQCGVMNHSLWNQTFDHAVGLMARIICVVYARIYTVFVPYATCSQPNPLPPIQSMQTYCLLKDRKFYHKIQKWISKSCPIPKSTRTNQVRFASRWSSPVLRDNIGLANVNSSHTGMNNSVFRLAPRSTVGGCGLTLRYANVIVFAERCLYAPATIGENARQSFYEMLPAKLKAMVRRKLKSQWPRKENELGDSDGHPLANGWSEALEEIMEWLTPLAHDTLKWQSERNLEKQKFDVNPRALLLQTLHYSDLEKTEATIVEVLVGLSCIYRYENRRNMRGSFSRCR
ncbi:hypothetical protein FNV43_RR09825 [Rhamnella rubrinervis]|uniref:Uncharacterized protein n=1 Tax=Rhamnella rubrinervis TaxID=2594499 RepID=A0A8K0HAN5_9ROSA|nr:hypothetical protein FNV43_RR09825 [Rhamnella rubrinervis]